MTIRERVAALSGEDHDNIQEHLRSAIFHLACCWDALREAEWILQGKGPDALDELDMVDMDIETDALSSITSEVGDPAEVFKIKLEDIVDHMEMTTI